MFLHNLQVTWPPHGRWILPRDVDRVDSRPRDRKSKHMRNPIISEAVDGRHVAWRGDIKPKSDARDHIAWSDERLTIVWTHLGIWRLINEDHKPRSTCDCGPILARSRRDRGSIEARSWLVGGEIKTTSIAKWWPSIPLPNPIKRPQKSGENSL